MDKILIKNTDNTYDGIVSNEAINNLEEELSKLKIELAEFEKELSKKMDKKSSEYRYEIGKFLSSKVDKYQEFVYDRRRLWDMLRDNVNTYDKNSPQRDKWDQYEYDYLLSKLDKELVVKYDKTYWDHFFDCTTIREDNRIYDWLKREDKITKKMIWAEFIKGVKVYLKNKDTSFMPDDTLFKYYDDILNKTLILVNDLEKNGNLKSKERDLYFEMSKKVSSSDVDGLNKILSEIRH